MKKFLLCCLSLLLIAASLALPIAASGREQHWYCVRNKAHKQMIAPPDLSVVERYSGYYIDHTHNDDNEEKVIYLTFDAGYENGNVAKILDILKETETTAAFFLLEHIVKDNADLVRRMSEEGHLICNHTATHKNLSRADAETIKGELSRLENACEAIGVACAPYFRPPEGSFSEELLKVVESFGYKTIFWSSAYADWDNEKQPSPEHAMRTVMGNIHNGQVLLLHPTSSTNVEILPRVIAELKQAGYRFGTLDVLCGK